MLDLYKGNKIGILYKADPYIKWVKLERVTTAPHYTHLEVSNPSLTGNGGFAMKRLYNINNLGPTIIATDEVEHIPNGHAPDGWQSRNTYADYKNLHLRGLFPEETMADPFPPIVRYGSIQQIVEAKAREAGDAARVAAERLAYSSTDPDQARQAVTRLLQYIGYLQDVERFFPNDVGEMPDLYPRF